MIYVTENGVSEKMLCTELCDEWRILYYKDYINEMLKGEWAHTCISTFFCLAIRSKVIPIFVVNSVSVVSLSYQRWSQCEGLHRMVPAGQVWVGRRLLREVRLVLCGLQEQKQASLSQSVGSVLQTRHQLQWISQSERGNASNPFHTNFSDKTLRLIGWCSIVPQKSFRWWYAIAL